MCRKLTGLTILAVLLSWIPRSAGGVPDPTLVGWWKLDDGAGTTARDSSGNGDHGVVHGTLLWEKGKLGGALHFDGATTYVQMPFSESLRVLNRGNFTLTLWVNTDQINNKQIVFQQGDLAGTGRSWLTLGDASTDMAIRCYLGGAWTSSGVIVEAQKWYHAAVVVTEGGSTDWIQMYVNGVPAGSPREDSMEDCEGVFIIGCAKTTTDTFMDGLVDDVRLYSRGLTQEEMQRVMLGEDAALASDPSPADQAAGVPREVVLAWGPGTYADRHDVYFGTSFADVNAATSLTALGPGQTYRTRQQATSYAVPERLALGQTYYWRVDEVNAPPAGTVFKGTVWSFTVEPVAYPIANVTAIASSVNKAGEGPQNTVNRSGLDTADLHSSAGADMWLSSPTGPQPTWIQYEFDQVHKLHAMWVWNYNTSVETVIGFGIREATIEYSVDGVNWTTLGTTHEFAQGPGSDGYAHNTTIDLQGIAAKYVKLTVGSNWGGVLKQYGLSEVRFFSVPVAAREPQPACAATGVAVGATLSWRAGREAAQHQILFGTGPNSLAPAATTQTPAYTPAMSLDTTYYWQVVEVNNAKMPATWPGAVWSFSTQPYLVVDDFESYTDKDGEAIFQTWPDGLENSANGGSQVGNDPAPYAEGTIVNSGRQSMPLWYNNTVATYSETTRTFAGPQDWTRYGIKGLTLRFYGNAANAAQQMYVKINNTKVLYDGAPEDLLRPQWQMWYVDLAALKVASVTKLSIGFDRIGAVGGQGKVFIDDIRLYPRDRSLTTPVDPGTTGLQARYQFEGNLDDSSGKGRKGSAKGAPLFVPGQFGQAVSLDGYDDYVNIDGYKGILGDTAGVQQPFTVSAWIKTKVTGTDILAWGANVGGQRMNLRVDTVLRVEHGSGNIRGTNGPSLLDDEWHHVAATVPKSGRIMDVKLYVDGVDVTPVSTTTAAFNVKAGTDVAIGMAGPVGGRFFNGQIDEVRIYDRVLLPTEITWLAGRTMPFDKPF